MLPIQPGIVATLPPHARYLAYRPKLGVDPIRVLANLAKAVDGNQVVAGIGQSLALALGRSIPGLKTFSALAGPGVDLSSTPMPCGFGCAMMNAACSALAIR